MRYIYRKLSYSFGFVYNYFSSIIHFTFVPISSMIQMSFSCNRACSNLRNFCFIVCSSFISSGRRLSSLRMCHYLLFLSVINFFKLSQRGSVFLLFSFIFFSLGDNFSNVLRASKDMLPSFKPGCNLLKGTLKTIIS